MTKRLVIIVMLLLIAVFALAQRIPHPADTPAYNAYKQSLIGQSVSRLQQPKPQNTQGTIPLAYQQQTRTGLLVPLDDTFTQVMAGGDDNYSTGLSIPFGFDFYGSSQTEFYINNNGNLSFGDPYSTFNSYGFPIEEFPLLAAFWADVDTRPEASGKVYYKVEPNRVTVIWNGVGYYANHTDKLNTFEIIFTNGLDPLIGIGNNVAFSYGDMQWTTGDASGGTNGFGGIPATVGINKGDGIHYSMIGRFDHAGTDYNGPLGEPSGISYLDNQLFTFCTMAGNYLPPMFSGVPTAPILLRVGDSTTINFSAMSPHLANTVDATVLHNFSSGFSQEIIAGNPCSISIQINADGSSLGNHLITVTAFDNGSPTLSTTIQFYVNVIMLNEWVLIANFEPCSLSLVDVSTNAVYGPFLSGQLGYSSLVDVAVSPDGQTALVSNFDESRVYHIDMSNPLNPSLSATYQLNFHAEDIAFSYDGRFAVVADGGTATWLAVLDLQTRTTIQNINIYPHAAQGVAVSIDGKVLVNNCDGSVLYLYNLDLQTGMLSYTGHSYAYPYPLNTCFSPEGDYALAVSYSDSNALLLKINPDNSMALHQTIPVGTAQSAIYSPDGTKVAIATIGSPSAVKTYNVHTNATLSLQNTFSLPTSSTTGFYGVDALAINSANSRIYVGGTSHTESFSPRCIDIPSGVISTLSTQRAAGVCIGNLPLKAYYSARVTNLPYSVVVQLKQFSTGAPESFHWNFGDGNSSTLQNPTHEYHIPGIYNITLTVQRGTYTHTLTRTIEAVFDPNIHLTLADSPYFFDSDLMVYPTQSITIDSGVVVNFAPAAGLIVNGRIIANGATFTGNETLGWKGISINTLQSPLVFDNCSIWHAIQALKIENTSFSINNLLVNKTNDFTDEVGILISGVSNLILNNVQVLNYASGIVFNNDALRTTTSPTITNVRIRNSSSSIRTTSRGLEVIGAVGLAINDAVIEEFDEGIYWDGQGTTDYRSTPTLSNVRIRNSSSSLRSAAVGLKLVNLSTVIATNDSIGGYPLGMEIVSADSIRNTTNATLTNVRIRNSSSSLRTEEFGAKLSGSIMLTANNLQIDDYPSGFFFAADSTGTRTSSSATLTNVRIRNSSSSLRTGTYGLKMLGGIYAAMDDVQIDEYDYGLHYQGNGLPFDRTTPTLSNVRIRNSSSSIRSADYGIKIMDLAAVIVENDTIDGYAYGISLVSTARTRTSNTATLTNVRIRNSSSSLRTETTGVALTGGIAAIIDSLSIEDYSTGIYYEGDGQPFDRTTPALSNVRIRNSSSSIREPAKGIVLKNLAAANLQKNIIYPNLGTATGNAEGMGITLENVSNAILQQNNIWGLTRGLSLENIANVSFTKNIIWTNGAELSEPIVPLVNNATIANNVISYAEGVYQEAGGNQDVDPLFVAPKQGDFYLKLRSPIRLTDIGAIPFSFDYLAANRTHIMHRGWNLMSVPYTTLPNQNTPTAIFSDDLNPFYVSQISPSIYQYNTNTNPTLGHLIFTNTRTYNVPAYVRCGVGYWVNNPYTYSAPVDVYGLMDDGDYLLQLPSAGGSANGWYMLGNPYDRPINFLDGSITIQGSIEAWAYVYDYVLNRYLTVDNNPDNDHQDGHAADIQPWMGFFVKAYGANDRMYLTYPQAQRQQPVNDPVADNDLAPASQHKPEWQITLQAATEGNGDAVMLGVAKAARAEYDPMDLPKLPNAPFALTESISLAIVNNSWEDNPGSYSRDYRNSDAGAWSWDLLLNLQPLLVDGRFAGRVSITPELSGKLPDTYKYALVYPATGQSCDLNGESLSLFLEIDTTVPNGDPSPWLIHFRVEVTPLSGSVIADTRAIISSGNYPNPFNPETTISYSLGQENSVTLDIYNVKGQLVKRLINAPQSAGKHSVVWNGKDSQGRDVASGFYFYRLNAGDSSRTQKILLMK